MNESVIKNPNFTNQSEFHRSLKARGKGTKDWENSHTEIEYLGGERFAATISIGHKVFFDEADGNKPKKHKLTDECQTKDHMLIQGARCCVEIYPYYAKYFDVQHKEVRLHEERWVVQRLFKEPDTWRDIDAYNPVITVEEYSEIAGDVVKVTTVYDTDYGILTIEYFQRDGNALKHNVIFENTSGATETFRVVQAWAGIVGDKCNGKKPSKDNSSSFIFHKANKSQKEPVIVENLWPMIFNPDLTEKTDQCLQRPVNIETHAQGMKVDFVYGNWVLSQGESLVIDPATATLNNPTVDGQIRNFPEGTYTRTDAGDAVVAYFSATGDEYRGYVEWDVSSIPDDATITNTVLKYHGYFRTGDDAHIYENTGARPSTDTDVNVWTESGSGTEYDSPAGFVEVGANKEADLGSSADTDLKSQLSVDWFAIGTKSDLGNHNNQFYTEDKTDAATPKPTLYVEYSLVARRIFVTHT